MQTLFKENLSVKRLTKGKLPSLPFLAFKNNILGKKYDLSIVFVGRNQARELNRIHRNKDYNTNILSFPLSESSGEIIISLEKVRRDAVEHNKSFYNFLGFLVIHGMLHLEGYEHGATMEKLEGFYCGKFKI